jgi:hypothetical protein
MIPSDVRVMSDDNECEPMRQILLTGAGEINRKGEEINR